LEEGKSRVEAWKEVLEENMGLSTTLRQNGKRLIVRAKSFEKQKRYILRREARSLAKLLKIGREKRGE